MTNKEKLNKCMQLMKKADELSDLFQKKRQEMNLVGTEFNQVIADIAQILDIKKQTSMAILEIDVKDALNRLTAEEYFRQMKEGHGNE